jgi:putative aldouronate transport system permease protein
MFRTADAVIISVVGLAALVCLVPIVHQVSLSFSSNSAVLGRKVWLWPVDFTLGSYREVFRDSSVVRSLYYTILLTAVYAVFSMALTIACAYPLTHEKLRGRKVLTTFIVFTMYFNGGILPTYVLIKELGLLDTMWGLVWPVIVNPFYMIIMRTAFKGIPDSLTESALIDGASYFRILASIILPLSSAILATLSLFYAVFRWNTFQDALFYITDPKLYTLQLKLTFIVLQNTAPEIVQAEGSQVTGRIVPAAITAATVVVATVPILIVYPWLQRYFISGVMIGSVKG